MSRREAHLDLDWSDQGIPQYEEAPLTFDIPGYEYDHAHSMVAITVREYLSDTFGFAFSIEGLKSPRGDYAQLWNDVDFGVPDGDTVEEMMRAAENITPQEIADALAANNYAPDDEEDDTTASRHASDQPTLGLDWEHGDPASTLGDIGLDWTRDLGDYAEYEAWLPVLPGYPEMHEKSSLVYVASKGGEYTFWMELALMVEMAPVVLTDMDFDLPHASSADEMMQEVETLTIQDILDALTNIGWPPESGGDTASRKASIKHVGNAKEGKHMIRKATRRIAHLDLDWEQDDVAGSWFAELPAIPGYPCYPYANDLYHSVQVADQSGLEGTDWAFYMYLNLKNEYVDLYNDDFGIPDTDTAEEMMNIVDNLSVQDIADVLAENGYMPDED